MNRNETGATCGGNSFPFTAAVKNARADVPNVYFGDNNSNIRQRVIGPLLLSCLDFYVYVSQVSLKLSNFPESHPETLLKSSVYSIKK